MFDLSKVTSILRYLWQTKFRGKLSGGECSSVINTLGARTDYRYDDNGQLVAETHPAKATYGLNSDGYIQLFGNLRQEELYSSYDTAGETKVSNALPTASTATDKMQRSSIFPPLVPFAFCIAMSVDEIA